MHAKAALATSLYKTLSHQHRITKAQQGRRRRRHSRFFFNSVCKTNSPTFSPTSRSSETKRAQEDPCRGQKLESAEHHSSLAVPQAERERVEERRKGAERTRLPLKQIPTVARTRRLFDGTRVDGGAGFAQWSILLSGPAALRPVFPPSVFRSIVNCNETPCFSVDCPPTPIPC